jgi:hypothetical protein
MASPTPVLPLVASMTVLSGVNSPDASAASIMARATRSLMDPPTFWASSLVARRMRGCGNTRFRYTTGVAPIRERMVG